MSVELEKIFFEAAGFHDELFSLVFEISNFEGYVLAGIDEETLELIFELSKNFKDPTQAEIGFIAVWRHLETLRVKNRKRK